MISKEEVKEVALNNGVDLFGIASVERFDKAPDGFHPKDVYSKAESVIVFAIRVPSETLCQKVPLRLRVRLPGLAPPVRHPCF